MTPKVKVSPKLKLAENILKASTSFELGQFEYKFNNDKDHIRVWSTKSTHGVFFHTDLIVSLSQLCNHYVDFNKDESRCELIIY